jgi:uncharacterized membrane protein YkoI
MASGRPATREGITKTTLGVALMRLAIRVVFVAVCTALFIAGGLSPRHTTTSNRQSDAARAATVVRVQQPSDDQRREPEREGRDDPAVTGAEGERARQAAQAAVPGATARQVEREAGDDENPRSAYEVELVRPDGSSVEVGLDAGFNVLASDRDDDSRDGD